MILLDTTIVTVATPAIIEDLDADVNSVVWVTSAYLLAYAVPVLITGRLGDRFGPKNLYLTGLALFTAASLWCGLTGSIEGLIIARVFQGFGASMMTPQTMAIITRIFAVERRGSAMALWGATAGVATLVGPVLGGVLTDGLGWEWIFFINVPVGLVAFALAYRLVPRLETHKHKFDWLGVALSGVGMFLLVFGIQEGKQQHWSPTIWTMIAGGIVVIAVFVLVQSRNTGEPLMPLKVFADRNFSISNLGIAAVSFSFTAMGFPLMLWAQVVRGYSPTEAGCLLIPMAVMSIVLAPMVGKLSDKVHPRILTGFGFLVLIGAMLLSALLLKTDTPLWQLLVAMGLIGVGSSFLWAVLTATATRNLPITLAGAGSGVYNALRQVGAVLGSAGIAVLIDSRLAAHGLEKLQSHEAGGGGPLPPGVADKFSEAMSQSLLLVPAVLVLGFLAVLLYERPSHFAPVASTKAVPANAE
ncbi:DHA2 family efflux MFS transporter permease subunit [Nocardioides marmoriginsengisoli]|uniref:DHA2 family efflux MFS transporter permease subunit n=2 Tax=Nocardioides marmoriginsengisoli TaxID=661483 RepID=A0A3N0CBL2_9ACTN|nr:DHA2 family efflux MFS transporter permease subunit [Nocardioides marmoriginsengisoli]